MAMTIARRPYDDAHPVPRQRAATAVPLRPLALALIAGGALLQHALVSAPAESRLAAPTTFSASAASASLATTDASRLAVSGGRFTTVSAIPQTPSRVSANVAPANGPSDRTRTAPTPLSLSTTAKATTKATTPAPGATSPRTATAAALVGTSARDRLLASSINDAFATYALPYQIESGLIVEVGRQFGIDPAIPAALFMHEDGNINNRSMFPQHMNWLLYHTHNPGNIKCMYDPCYNGFQVYPTYRAGILDWFRLYDHYYYDLGIHDLSRFVATYCPPNVDGNGPPSGYQSDVQMIATRIHTAAGL